MTRARKFDHDEARRLRAEGRTLQELADKYGVHFTRIWQICHRDPDKFRAHHREYQRRTYGKVRA